MSVKSVERHFCDYDEPDQGADFCSVELHAHTPNQVNESECSKCGREFCLAHLIRLDNPFNRPVDGGPHINVCRGCYQGWFASSHDVRAEVTS